MSNEGDFRTVPAKQGLLKTFKAMQSQKSRKYFIKRQESWSACKNTLDFFRFQFGDSNISDIFDKIIKLNLWALFMITNTKLILAYVTGPVKLHLLGEAY